MRNCKRNLKENLLNAMVPVEPESSNDGCFVVLIIVDKLDDCLLDTSNTRLIESKDPALKPTTVNTCRMEIKLTYMDYSIRPLLVGLQDELGHYAKVISASLDS